MWPLNSPDLNLWDLLEKQVCSIEAPPQRTGLRRSNNDLVPVKADGSIPRDELASKFLPATVAKHIV